MCEMTYLNIFNDSYDGSETIGSSISIIFILLGVEYPS